MSGKGLWQAVSKRIQVAYPDFEGLELEERAGLLFQSAEPAIRRLFVSIHPAVDSFEDRADVPGGLWQIIRANALQTFQADIIRPEGFPTADECYQALVRSVVHAVRQVNHYMPVDFYQAISNFQTLLETIWQGQQQA